jgi:uncharacterized membrane protein
MEVLMSGTYGFDFWWLIPLILIVLCFFCARGCCSGRRHRSEDRPERKNEATSDSALDILSKLYAQGKIDDEEYEKKSRTITLAKKGERK